MSRHGFISDCRIGISGSEMAKSIVEREGTVEVGVGKGIGSQAELSFSCRAGEARRMSLTLSSLRKVRRTL